MVEKVEVHVFLNERHCYNLRAEISTEYGKVTLTYGAVPRIKVVGEWYASDFYKLIEFLKEFQFSDELIEKTRELIKGPCQLLTSRRV